MQPTHNAPSENVRMRAAELLNGRLAAAVGVADPADIFTDNSRGVDDQLWFVESHVSPK